MATIRQRLGKYQAIVKRKGYPTQSRTFGLRKDAERWARGVERELDAGEWIDRTSARQSTLAELLTRYLAEVTPTKRGGSVEAHRIALLQRSPLAKYSPAAITPAMVATWRDKRLAEVSSGTVLRELVTLSHVFAVAMRDWGVALAVNPVAAIRKPSAGKPRDRVLTDAERAALLAACAHCRNSWVKPVVIFALETAARRGEILTLMWADLDMGEATAYLSKTKTGQPRKVPLSPDALSMLRTLPRSLDGRVFPITASALQQAYGRAVERAGLHNLTFHDLRHDALTRLARLGFNVLELRAISGHSTANMLQRYVQIDAGDLASKLSEVSQPLGVRSC